MRQFLGHISIEHASALTRDRVHKFLHVTNSRTVFRWKSALLSEQPNLVFIDTTSAPVAYLDAPTYAFKIFVGEVDAAHQHIARGCHFRLERDFTLMQFIDLLDRVSVKILDRPLTVSQNVPSTQTKYRLTQWVMLAKPFNDVRYYKALGLMSMQPMDAQQLVTGAALSAQEVTALLEELKKRQVLQVLQEKGAASDEALLNEDDGARSGPQTLLGRLKRWVLSSRDHKPAPSNGSGSLTAFTLTR